MDLVARPIHGLSPMRIRWHGHDCFELESEGGTIVVTDPHDGKSIGIAPPRVKADLVLISHDHFDHNCSRVVSGNRTKVINSSGHNEHQEIRMLGIDTYHDQENGLKRGGNIVFKLSMDGLNICHLGDLGHSLSAVQLEEIGKLDILFIPVGGTFTIEPNDAFELINALSPKIAIPMHYRVGGLSLSIKPVDDFLGFFREEDVVRVGNEIEFHQEDLPEGREIWVFSL